MSIAFTTERIRATTANESADADQRFAGRAKQTKSTGSSVNPNWA